MGIESNEAMEDRRSQAAAWLRDHGIDPARVPIDGKLYADGDGWNILVRVVGPKGGNRVDGDGLPVMEAAHIVDDGTPPPAWLLPSPEQL